MARLATGGARVLREYQPRNIYIRGSDCLSDRTAKVPFLTISGAIPGTMVDGAERLVPNPTKSHSSSQLFLQRYTVGQ